MDPISLVVGGGLLLFGYVAGLLTRRKREPKPLTADCGCGHSLAMHDPENGNCHAEVQRKDSYGKDGTYVGTTYAQCPCRQYVGPRPIEEFLAPKYLPPA
ncbi:hypothetical protein N8J89_18830 [Crossiella sp. CA-258035]|uniref:hypothetical protein n=1 Tax=Crossiella sp. CA-258035 TaxID=2981138 RepID=UPI0024BC2394|nr:hypothetical protein [Crossiella sp. CA-258035]WHT23045.1 hypothetical protein N8J89_18830 [Crossiella sp. CA-258035]